MKLPLTVLVGLNSSDEAAGLKSAYDPETPHLLVISDPVTIVD